MTRVLVCGGRSYSDKDRVEAVLNGLGEIEVLIHGGANGADSIAAIWAIERSVPEWKFDADWDKHGKAAGPIRNQQMLDEGKPDLVVAFPGGRGTTDMITRSRAKNIKVQVVFK